MEEQRGHFGCPECGCREFTITQDYRDYGTCTATCTFNEQKQSSSQDFDVDDRDRFDTHNSDYDDFSDDYCCTNCNHDFTDPAWYDETPEEAKERVEGADKRRKERTEEEERERIEQEMQAPYKAIIDKLDWHDGISVEALPHATVITAKPSFHRTSDESREEHYTMAECACCGKDYESLPQRTCQMYFKAPTPSGREKWIDRRGLPVMLRASLCKECQHIGVIQTPATAA